jgi:hypothetical protein
MEKPINVLQAVALALEHGALLCSFGDMLRVPGSAGTLLEARAEGADVRMSRPTAIERGWNSGSSVPYTSGPSGLGTESVTGRLQRDGREGRKRGGRARGPGSAMLLARPSSALPSATSSGQARCSSPRSSRARGS